MKRLTEFFWQGNLPVLIYNAFHDDTFQAGRQFSNPATTILAVMQRSVNRIHLVKYVD